MKTSLLWAVCALTACATPGARPHDMSTRGHEAAATDEERQADQHQAQYDPSAQRRPPTCAATARSTSAAGYDYDACWSSVLNPTEGHQNEAETHRRRAADHRAASAALREAEATACTGIAPGDRDMSPFMHTGDIATVSSLNETVSGGKQASYRMAGATIVFRAVPGMTAEWLQRLVDCHLARNASLGHDVPEMPNCPLVPKGVTARVKSAGGGFAVEVRSDDPAIAREVLNRAERLRSPGASSGTPVSGR